MATMTNEQIEQKKQQLKQLAEEVKTLKDELMEAGAWPMDEDDLDNVTGGTASNDGKFTDGLDKATGCTAPNGGRFNIVNPDDQYNR
jgi:hypothetical protein